jgi:hypothetical protein
MVTPLRFVASPRFVAPLIVALVALAAARLAMLPGVGFWDTAELQTVGPLMGTAHPTGFPTYVLLGWVASVVLQPFGDPAFRMNLLSAICVAVAAGVTVDLVRALTGSVVLGVVAGVGIALTPIAWGIATHAEAHALHLALVAVLLRLLVAWDARVRRGRGDDLGDRYLVTSAVVFGLAVGNHSLTLLLAIPVGLYVLAVDPAIWRRWRLVLTCVGALALTVVVVYLELPLRAGPFRAALVYGQPNTVAGFLYVTLAQQFQGSLLDPFGELPRKFGELIARTVAQFGILAPLIPIAFVATVLRRPRYALLTGSAVAITCFFNASYVNADIGRYYLGPILMAWTWLAILAGLALDAVAASTGEARPDPDGAPTGARQGMGTRAGLAGLVIAVVLLTPTVLAAPARFDAVNVSHDYQAAGWTAHALSVMEPDAVIVSWWSYSTPLWYAQLVEGQRPDIAIVDDRTRLDESLGDVTDVIDANLGKRPVYLIRSDRREIASLTERYVLDYIDGTDASALTRVVSRRAAAS